ncbi:MAG: hypothetical protein KDC92_02525 [Bacteroidetes bacterium]|nr:hypothetical protein [Bacteroidota bacterium]
MRALFISLLLFTSSALVAQMPNWAIELGGAGFYFQSDYEITNGFTSLFGTKTNGNFQSRIGTYIMPNLGVGFSTRGWIESTKIYDYYDNFNTNQKVDYEARQHIYTYGLYARYLYELSPTLGVFVNGEIGLGNGYLGYNEEDTLGGIEEVVEDRSVAYNSVGLGVYLFPSEFILISAQVNRHMRTEQFSLTLPNGTIPITENFSGYRVELGIAWIIDTENFFRRSSPIPKNSKW